MKGKETCLFTRVELNKISALGKEISKEKRQTAMAKSIVCEITFAFFAKFTASVFLDNFIRKIMISIL